MAAETALGPGQGGAENNNRSSRNKKEQEQRKRKRERIRDIPAIIHEDCVGLGGRGAKIRLGHPSAQDAGDYYYRQEGQDAAKTGPKLSPH